MSNIRLDRHFVIVVIVLGIISWASISWFRSASAKETKSQAVIELEKEIAPLVKEYNQLAPRLEEVKNQLRKKKGALELLDFTFDDSKMTAVFQ